MDNFSFDSFTSFDDLFHFAPPASDHPEDGLAVFDSATIFDFKSLDELFGDSLVGPCDDGMNFEQPDQAMGVDPSLLAPVDFGSDEFDFLPAPAPEETILDPDQIAAALAVLARANPDVLSSLIASQAQSECSSASAYSPSFASSSSCAPSPSFKSSPSPPARRSPHPPSVTRTQLKAKSEEDLAQRKFQCSAPGCSWSFARKHNLINHMRLHDVDREAIVCSHPGCGKQFSRKYDLVRHAKAHSGEKEFVCMCGAEFARKDKFTSHIKACTGERTVAKRGKKSQE